MSGHEERVWCNKQGNRLEFKQAPSESILLPGITSLPTFEGGHDFGTRIIEGSWDDVEKGEGLPLRRQKQGNVI